MITDPPASASAPAWTPDLLKLLTRCRTVVDSMEPDGYRTLLAEIDRQFAVVAALAQPSKGISDAQCMAAMREFSAQKGESFEAMWDQMDEQIRAELLGEWRAVLECAALAQPAGPTEDTLRLDALHREGHSLMVYGNGLWDAGWGVMPTPRDAIDAMRRDYCNVIMRESEEGVDRCKRPAEHTGEHWTFPDNLPPLPAVASVRSAPAPEDKL